MKVLKIIFSIIALIGFVGMLGTNEQSPCWFILYFHRSHCFWLVAEE